MLLSGFHVFGVSKAAKKRYKLTHKIVLAVLWRKILLVLHWPKQYLAILWQGHTFCPAWFPLFRLNIFRLVRWNVLCWVVALICLGGFEILAITFLHNLDICLLPNKKSCKIIKHVSTVVIKILDCVKLSLGSLSTPFSYVRWYMGFGVTPGFCQKLINFYTQDKRTFTSL